MLKDIFPRNKGLFDLGKEKKTAPGGQTQANVPDKMWARCNACDRMLYEKMLMDNLKVCPMCSYHFRLTPEERVKFTFDGGKFEAFNFGLEILDPLEFPDYKEKLKENQTATGISDAVYCGVGEIGGIRAVACIMNSFFMMGSMGHAVGESITRSIEYAMEHRLPLIIFTASGGARMQEGIVSLMQMAKISGALKKLSDMGILYITVITHPTTGGVTASFASLGDVIISEKGALIGFAGKRVIEQTIKQKLPKDFQTAEFAEQHGFVDVIEERKNLKALLYKLLLIHSGESDFNA